MTQKHISTLNKHDLVENFSYILSLTFSVDYWLILRFVSALINILPIETHNIV